MRHFAELGTGAQACWPAKTRKPFVCFCRSESLDTYEEIYFNITSNSTGVDYNLTRPPIPWNYTQCAIADSQFFWAGESCCQIALVATFPAPMLQLHPSSQHHSCTDVVTAATLFMTPQLHQCCNSYTPLHDTMKSRRANIPIHTQALAPNALISAGPIPGNSGHLIASR